MTIPVEKILSVLRFHPAGMTAKQIAARLGARENTMSGRLSKLALYGRIDRDITRATTNGITHHRCVYRPKEAASA